MSYLICYTTVLNLMEPNKYNSLFVTSRVVIEIKEDSLKVCTVMNACILWYHYSCLVF